MVVTELGIDIDVKVMKPRKASFSILFTVLGIIVFLQPWIRALVLVLMMALHPFAELNQRFSSSTVIVSRLRHVANAPSPIVYTFLGMVMEVKPQHP